MVELSAPEPFTGRVAHAIDKPIATLFVEDGSDRHFIIEITVSAVAGYLGGKFLDGFIEGLGVKAAGKALGEEVRHAVERLGAWLVEGDADPAVIDREAATLQAAANQLASHATDPEARRRGEAAVDAALQEKGLPASEARRIAGAIGAAVLVPAASHG